MRRALHLLMAMVIAILGWMVAPTTSAVAVPDPPRVAYNYDDAHHPAAVADGTTERGPPSADALGVPHATVDHGSRGTSARLRALMVPADTTYNHPGSLAYATLATSTTGRQSEMAGGDLSSLMRWHVAAKPGEELAHLGQGWRATSFGDEASSFEYHYAEHGLEEGVTMEQYAQDALDWARNPAGTGKPVQLKDGTEGLRYRTPGGGPGGIVGLDGNIITYWYR